MRDLQACGLLNSQGSGGLEDGSMYASNIALPPLSRVLMTIPLICVTA